MNKDDFMDELLAKTDLVQLVGEYVRLERRGTAYWGCCPFHHEKTASFMITPEKQLYYCHGACHEGGNAVTFVKKIESVSPSDAVAILAKRAGMQIPETVYRKRDDAEMQKKKERLYALMRDAARRYHENLKSPQAKAACHYLEERGISNAMITKFGLGVSLNSKDMIAYLSQKGYTAQEMKDANIAVVGEHGAYDTFYERLMVPIINQFGEIVAFGGRTLVKNPEFAKYKNSAQGLIFDKSKTIYAVNLLQKRKQKAMIESIILCEGYMDVISLHNAGFDTAVASMGTSLTFYQAKQLKNFAGRVFVSYDGDAAGQKAALRSLDILAEAGLTVRVVKLPDGMDPDDAVRQKGADFYQRLLDEAVTLPAFKIETLKKQFDLTDSDGKAKFAVAAVRVVRALENPVEQEEYLNLIQELTGYSMDALRRQAEIADDAVSVRPVIEPQAHDDSTDSNGETIAKRFVLASIAANKQYVDFTEDFSNFLRDEFSKTVATYFLQNRKEKTESVGSLYELVDEQKENELSAIMHYQFISGDDEVKYRDCVTLLKMVSLRTEKEELGQQFQATKDKVVLSKILEVERKIKQLKNGGEV